MLDRPRDDVFVGYNAEQVVEQGRRQSSYTVINTESASGVGSAAVFSPNDDDGDGDFNFLFFRVRSQFAH